MFLLLYILLSTLTICKCDPTPISVSNEYVQKLYSDVEQKVINGFREDMEQKRDTEVTFEFLGMEHYIVSTQVVAMEIFDTKCALIGNTIYQIRYYNDRFVIQPHSVLTRVEDEILFIKSTQYLNTSLLVVSFMKGYSNVYVYEHRKWIFMQTIATEAPIVDLQLFYYHRRLYMIAVNKNEHYNYKVPSILYEWTGSHFDEIDKTYTQGATSVNLFHYENDVIIIITQNIIENYKAGTLIFKYNNQHGLRKIQYLKTPGAIKSNPYYFNKDTFLIIGNTHSKSTTYLWTGKSFIQWSHFHKFYPCYKTSVEIIENQPLYFVVNTRGLLVYDVNPSENSIIDSIPFDKKLDKINSYNVIQSNGFKFVFVSGLSRFKQVVMYFVPFKIHYETVAKQRSAENNMETKMVEPPLISCLRELQNKMLYRKELIDSMLKQEGSGPYPPKGVSQTTGPYHQKLSQNTSYLENSTPNEVSTIQNGQIQTYPKKGSPKFDEQFMVENRQINSVSLEGRLKNLKTKIDSLSHNLAGNVEIRGNLQARTINSPSVTVETINNRNWEPQKWLFNNRYQIIPMYPASKHEIITKNLEVTPGSPLYELILKDGDQKFSTPVVLNSLKANNIHVKTINGINFDDIYLKSSGVAIGGKKVFDQINAEDVTLTEKEREKLLQVLNEENSGNHFNVENLNVEFINGLNWNSFVKSVLVRGENQLSSNVVINGDVKVKDLNVEKLVGVDYNKIVTTSTDQTISSDFQLYHITGRSIISDNINGVDFSTDVAHLDGDRIIKGPVSIKNIDVLGNLTVSKELKIDDSLLDTESFYQNYRGHIKIIGDLFVNNLNFDRNCEIYHQDIRFDFAKLPLLYWMKNTPQIVHQNVKFRDVSSKFVETANLNRNPIESYIKTTDKVVKFKNLTIQNLVMFGNLTTNIKNQGNDPLKRLIQETVKSVGSFVTITGHKIYQNELTIDRLETNVLNGDFRKDDSEANGVDELHYSTVRVKGNVFVSKETQARINHFNGVNLKELIGNTIFINRDYKLQELHLGNLKTPGIQFDRVNDIDVDEIWNNVTKLYNDKNVNKIIFKGNAILENVKVQNIGDINVDTYLSTVLTDRSQSVQGPVKFLGTPYIQNLVATHINDLNIEDIQSNYLSRNRDQTIRSIYHFREVGADNVFSIGINEFGTEALINGKNNPIILNGTFHFNKIYVEGHVTSTTFNCDLKQATNALKFPPPKHWPHVTTNNAYVHENTGVLSEILFNLVHKDISRPIHGDITLDHLSVNTLLLDRPFINGINFEEIFEDSLMKNVEGQVVTAEKRFNALKVLEANVRGNVDIPIINNIDIVDLNGSIIYKNQLNGNVIHQNKIFSQGLRVKHLIIPESITIHDVLPKNLITLSESNDLSNAHFTNLKILNDINFENLNEVSFLETLKGRLLIKSDVEQYIFAPMTFGTMNIIGNSFIESINDVRVDEMVTDEGTQIIQGRKTFAAPVVVSRDANIQMLNGYNLNEEYSKVALIGPEVIEVPKNILFKSPVQVLQGFNVSKLHGIDIHYLDHLLRADSFLTKTLNPDIFIELQQLYALVDEAYPVMQEYLYIEPSNDLEISIPSSMSATVLQKENNIQLNVVSQENGALCGLSDECHCPTQYSLWITPQMTVVKNLWNNTQRLFSFYEDGFTVSLVTQTVSSSHVCKTKNQVEEHTYLTWHGREQYEPFTTDVAPGYIRDAKFFKRNGNLYLVIIRFYDGVLDSHNLDCSIRKLTNNGTQFEVIQTILTTGAWAMEILETGQGITLIIGNIYDSDYQNTKVDTEIYRFDDEKEEFQLLRSVSTNSCTAVTGIVINEEDSLIILAEFNNLLVLRYNEYSDNYLFFQSLRLDSNVLGVNAFHPSDTPNEIFLAATTFTGHFYIYTFKYIEGWKLKMKGNMDGLQTLVPFELKKQPYLFAPSTNYSKLLKIATQSSNDNGYY